MGKIERIEVPPANDPFGKGVSLVEKNIVYVAGSGIWESGFSSIVAAFKTVYGAMAKQGLKANGPPMTIYTATDDTSFQFRAAVPVEQAPTLTAGSEIAVGKALAGKALMFIHRGSYEALDSTYEAVTDYLDEKKLEGKDPFIEQYMKDPLSTPEDDLVIEIYVPLK
jgi:effector-binding domain-containing protein